MKRLYAPSKSARRSAHASGFCGTCATAEPDITNNNATRNNLITTSSMSWKGNTQKVGVIHQPPLLSGAGTRATAPDRRGGGGGPRDLRLISIVGTDPACLRLS